MPETGNDLAHSEPRIDVRTRDRTLVSARPRGSDRLDAPAIVPIEHRVVLGVPRRLGRLEGRVFCRKASRWTGVLEKRDGRCAIARAHFPFTRHKVLEEPSIEG